MWILEHSAVQYDQGRKRKLSLVPQLLLQFETRRQQAMQVHLEQLDGLRSILDEVF